MMTENQGSREGLTHFEVVVQLPRSCGATVTFPNRYVAAAGWTVLRFWEHKQPESAMRVVVEARTQGGPRLPPWQCFGAVKR
ncbi:hypothetical protein [Streptomyces sp900116325]|uniref:hypothetical protein n=1 Tax=Streptomyces sp. 900116325 TaxID=3154295 RepID=UPI0033A32B79